MFYLEEESRLFETLILMKSSVIKFYRLYFFVIEGFLVKYDFHRRFSFNRIHLHEII